MKSLPWILGGLVAGGILHILCVFSIPYLSQRNAWALLSQRMKTNTLMVANEKSQAQLPFTSPDVVTAYCLFDVSEHNVVIRSPLVDRTWSLAISTRAGENFYLTTGADAKKPEIRLLIVRRSRLPEEISTERTDEGEEQNIIVSPATHGILAIRAPIRGESYRAQTLAELQKARCELQKTVEPVIASVSEPAKAEPVRNLYNPQGRYRGRRRR